MPRLLIDLDIETARLERLAAGTGLDVQRTPEPSASRRSLPDGLLAEVSAMLTTHVPTNVEAAKALQWIQLASAGFAQVEGLGLSGRGVRVCTASGVNDVPIAEWTLMMMIALARDLSGLMQNQQTATWDRDPRFQQEIRGRTLGIWGYGGIGRESARLASALGLRVHVLTRSGKVSRRDAFGVPGTGDDAGKLPAKVFAADEAIDFCAGLDFLLLAMPLTPQNEGLVGSEHFEAMPPHAFLLNPARGKLVREADLLNALRTGGIAGAALDTHFQTPLPPAHPLWAMPNVIITPHISGSSQSPHFVERLCLLFETNVRRWQDQIGRAHV